MGMADELPKLARVGMEWHSPGLGDTGRIRADGDS
jgi:hypothetical protein